MADHSSVRRCHRHSHRCHHRWWWRECSWYSCIGRCPLDKNELDRWRVHRSHPYSPFRHHISRTKGYISRHRHHNDVDQWYNWLYMSYCPWPNRIDWDRHTCNWEHPPLYSLRYSGRWTPVAVKSGTDGSNLHCCCRKDYCKATDARDD